MTTVSEIEPAPQIQPQYRVLIYDPEPGQYYGQDAHEGAVEAGWQSLMYDSIDLAVDELDVSINALITGMLVGRVGIKPLIEVANKLKIPRAVFSENQNNARKYIRRGTADCFLSKCDSRPSEKVEAWLTTLAMLNNASIS